MTHKRFPDGFLWGAATSAHQVEGNTHNDWSEWERANAERLAKDARSNWQPWQQEKFPEMLTPENYISGAAVEHYRVFEEDFDIAAQLGCTAQRISLEWSRIEPQRGVFDEREVAHYRDVIRALKTRNLEPFVTLWHWTNPVWVAEQGGWEESQTVEDFLAYVEHIVGALADEGIRFWMPLNEPGTFVGMGYVQGAFPPQKRSILSANRVFKNLMRAYRQSYHIIHERVPAAEVGMSHYAVHMIPYKGTLVNRLLVRLLDYVRNWRFLDSINDTNDFIGLQYYHTDHIALSWRDRVWKMIPIAQRNPDDWVSDLGWLLYPAGIYPLLMRAARYGKPIYITENGLADRDDTNRARFLRETLEHIHRAITAGVPVRGYIHWSLLDNFEWNKGFWPRFGLVAVDYTTQERCIRDSARVYADIMRANAIE